MAIVTQGNVNKVDNAEVDSGCSSHREAAAAARARSRGTKGRAAVGFKPTIGVQLFFSFEDAQWYVEVPPDIQASAFALRAAMEGGANDDDLAKIVSRPASELAAEQILWVQAQQLDKEAVDGNGVYWDKGSWLIKPEEGRAYITDVDDFARFRDPTDEEQKRHGTFKPATRLRPQPSKTKPPADPRAATEGGQ